MPAAAASAPRVSKCPVMRTWYVVTFMLTYLVAGVRGYAATSLTSISDRFHAADRSVVQQQTLLKERLTPQCASTVLRCAAPRGALQGCEQHWRCGGGKGLSGRRRFNPPPSMCEPGPEQSVLILGAGWVGSRVAQSLMEDGVSTVVTHRPGTDVQKKPPYFRPLELIDCATEPRPCATRCEFDLAEPSTWEGLPAAETLAGVVVTFPMVSPEAFWDSYLNQVAELGKPVLCYSTTSVYQVDTPGQLVDEETPLRVTPRVEGEEYVQSRGATILTISGIFGDQRTPRAICTCLSTYTSAGGALNGRKQINMVHVDDIVQASRACLRDPQPKRRINVAGHHFFLSELISHCKHPAVPDAPDQDLSSKCVESNVLLSELMPDGYEFVQPLTRTRA